MKPPDFEYARPTSVADAVDLLAEADGDAKVLAGGQSLVPLLNFRLASPSLLVDLNRVTGLTGVAVEDGMLRVGAMTRTRVLETDPVVRTAIPVLADAARWVGHVQIRNRGTVGGTLAHADPAAEIPAIAVLLGAELVAVGPGGERRIGIEDFVLGFLATSLAETEVLTEIRFPVAGRDVSFGFREFAPRRGDFALGGAAVALSRSNGSVDRARIVIFGTADRPVRATAAEDLLAGRTITPQLAEDAGRLAAEAASLDDPRPDASYRRLLFATLASRAIEDAVNDGQGEREVA